MNDLNALKPRLDDWNIKRLRVFGSVLHGDAGPDSDVDLIVDFYKKPDYFSFFDIRDRMEEMIGRRIDLLTEDSIDPYIKNKVLREAKDIHDR